MQNDHEKSKGFRSFVKDKGYYIVLLLCAAAVGVSGYLLLTNQDSDTQDTMLSVTENSTDAPSKSSTPSNTTSSGDDAEDVVVTQGDTPTQTTEPVEEKTEMKTMAPVEGEPINTFAIDFLAYNTTTRDWRTHDGIDFSAELGAEVVAAAAGSVYTIYEDESLGMTVVLRHADGYTTHYSNLAKEVAVQVGDTVEAGAVLGTVGQTAGIETASESHLHFAVYLNNTPVDPSEFLKLS